MIIENIDGAMVIRFNHPEVRNPLSVHVLEGLNEILLADAVTEKLKAIIFTGIGDVFASGADLREIAGITAESAKEFAIRGQALMNRIASLSPNTYAAINGYCFGGALDLAVACKYRIASPKAMFSHPGANLGIITGWGGTQRLPRLIGEAAALEMFFTAKRVEAEQALRLGLIDEIAADPVAAAMNRIMDA